MAAVQYEKNPGPEIQGLEEVFRDPRPF